MITPGWNECKVSYRDVEIESGQSGPWFKYDKVIQRRIQLSFSYPQNTIIGIPRKQVETYNTTLNGKSVFDILMVILKPIISKEFYKPNLWLS